MEFLGKKLWQPRQTQGRTTNRSITFSNIQLLLAERFSKVWENFDLEFHHVSNTGC